MDYSELCNYYQKLDSTTKRLEKTSILVELLKKASVEDLKPVIYLLHGTVFPEWDPRKLGVSSQIIIKALVTSMGVGKEEVVNHWKRLGDLGLAAEELDKKKKQKTLHSEKLTVKKVFNNIEKLATLEGKGTVANKVQLLAELLGNADSIEARYVVRTVLGNLRVGVAEGIVRDAISQTYHKEIKEIEEAFNLLLDYAEVAILAKGNKLQHVELHAGRPINMMLAVPATDINEAFEIVGKPAQFEYKLDGFRLQIHRNDGTRLFTRRFEEVSSQFPDIIKFVKEYVSGKSFILDCEAVGIDKKNGKYLPFQSISQRIKRKYGIEEMSKNFPVELNLFDVIYYNGENLFSKSLEERRKLLEKIVKQEKGKIILTKKLVTDNEKDANDFFKQALAAGVEGLMGKNLKGEYRPGRYVGGWIKLKKILEPLDLVIVKADWGEGKRASSLSSYTVACRNGGKLEEIGKVSTGMKEKSEGLTFEAMTKMLKPLIIKSHGRGVEVKPEIVVEIGYQEIQKSTNYSSGFALRFPRVLRLRTDEKTVKQINTLQDVKNIFEGQLGKKKQGKFNVH